MYLLIWSTSWKEKTFIESKGIKHLEEKLHYRFPNWTIYAKNQMEHSYHKSQRWYKVQITICVYTYIYKHTIVIFIKIWLRIKPNKQVQDRVIRIFFLTLNISTFRIMNDLYLPKVQVPGWNCIHLLNNFLSNYPCILYKLILFPQ